MAKTALRFLASCAAALWLSLVSSPEALAVGASGVVQGRVLGPDGTPLAAVLVQLRNDISGFKADATTGRDGGFHFFNVPFNPYELHVEVQGFAPVHKSLDVRTSIPRDVEIKLDLPAVAESVSVMAEPTAAQLETDNTTSHIDIDKSFIQRAPAAVPMRAMEEIVTSTPGFALDENGGYHFQGAHSQSEFVIDGQTIADQTGVTFSNSIDPGIAQSMEVIYGNVPAEFGEKVGAVINMTTKSGLGSPFKGTVIGSFATFDTYQGGFSMGGGTQEFGVFASVNAAGPITSPTHPIRTTSTTTAKRSGPSSASTRRLRDSATRFASRRCSAVRTATFPTVTRRKTPARRTASRRTTRITTSAGRTSCRPRQSSTSPRTRASRDSRSIPPPATRPSRPTRTGR